MDTQLHPNALLAMRLADEGYSVFPCVAGGKRLKQPAGGIRWRDESTSDIGRVEGWWASMPGAAVGLDIGKSGLLVIDVDCHEGGADGMEAWRHLLELNGATLDDFPTVKTPSGGLHCYFRQPDGAAFGNGRGKLPAGIDVRGVGGYVIAPGTVLVDGRSYQSIDDMTNPPPLPEWLARFLVRETGPQERHPAGGTPARDAYVAVGLARELELVRTAPKGQRNETLNRAAFAIGQMVGAGWLRRVDAEAMLHEAATSLARDDGENAVRTTIISGLDAGEKSPRAAPNGRRKQGIDPPPELGNEGGNEEHEASAPPRLDPFSVASLEGKACPARPWFVEDWIPDRNVTSLYGSGGTGKSLLALQICTAAAVGGEWLGMPVAMRKVLYLSCEDDADELHRRQRDINARLGLTFADFEDRYSWLARPGEDNILFHFPRNGAGRATSFGMSLAKMCKREGIGLLVIDTAADVFGGNEIVRSEVRQFLAYLRKIAVDCDAAVVLLAHPSVAGQGAHGYSGSTAWQGSVRSLLTFEHASEDEGPGVADLRTLTRKKSNYSRVGHQLQLKWEAGAFEPLDTDTSLDREFLDQRAFLRGLSRALDAGLCPSAAKSRSEYAPRLVKKMFAKDFQGITIGRLEAAMKSLFEAGEIAIQTHRKGSSPLTPKGYDLSTWRREK